jgi:multidrug transporter EmrE-like cation transporter
MNAILYLTLCLLADGAVAVADVLAKRWVLGEGLKYLFLAFGLYMIATASWLTFFRFNGDLGRSTVIWCASGIVVSIIIGVFYFNETLTILNKIGVVFCLTGVVFVAIK